jgi:uncharacterized membrane protein YgdD (TMEM256/DUF423 family)
MHAIIQTLERHPGWNLYIGSVSSIGSITVLSLETLNKWVQTATGLGGFALTCITVLVALRGLRKKPTTRRKKPRR